MTGKKLWPISFFQIGLHMHSVPQNKDKFPINNLFHCCKALLFTQSSVCEFLCGLIFMGHPVHMVFVPIWGKTLVPYCRTKRQKNHCFNMVRLRKISLAESRGSSRFFNNKVVSDFDFGHFLKKSIYCCHLWANFLAKGGGLGFTWTLFPIHF